MTTPDPEQIAAGLTKAQRQWLISMPATLADVPREPCAAFWDLPDSLCVSIGHEDYWLGSKQMSSPEGALTFVEGSERLTPLGLAVCNIVKDQPND